MIRGCPQKMRLYRFNLTSKSSNLKSFGLYLQSHPLWVTLCSSLMLRIANSLVDPLLETLYLKDQSNFIFLQVPVYAGGTH